MSTGSEQPSRWLPEPDINTHQAIGKLGEEAAELAAICSRILIQGIDGANPDTGKTNRKALMDEVADVRALAAVVQARVAGLDNEWDPERMQRKINMKCTWLDMVVVVEPTPTNA